MPSGYTSDFENKDLSFEEFVWKCARAMGAFIHMRDDSLKAKIQMPEMSDYHEVALKRAQQRLVEARKFTLKQADKRAQEEYSKRMQSNEESLMKKRLLRNRYTKMLNKVNAWKAPSPDHENFKKFMIDQLTQSIDWDCNEKYIVESCSQPRMSAEEWLDREIRDAAHDVKYHAEHLEEDIRRHQEVVKWITDLQESVPLP